MNAVSLGRRALLSLLLSLAFGVPAMAACTQIQALRTEPLVIATPHGPARLTVEIADTDQSRETGLMCRTHMAPDRGMLFDFKEAQTVEFWMKNTLIPLDMVFIGDDGRIVSIAHNAKPMDETPIPSGGPILGVLEIAGGRADALGLKPGERVRERIFPR